jgi:hypothetical protein
VPLNAWFRLRRAVENTPTILIAIEQEPNAKTCASLVLNLSPQETRWTQTAGSLEDILPWGYLLERWTVSAEIVRSRVKAVTHSWTRENVISTENYHDRGKFPIQAMGDYNRKFVNPHSLGGGGRLSR